MIALTQQAKGIRISSSESAALNKRPQEKVAGVSTRMLEAMKSAVSSGKFSPSEMQSLSQKIQDARNATR